MSLAQDQGFRQAFQRIASRCRNMDMAGWRSLTDEQIESAAYMCRRGCLIHYQRNVRRVTRNPKIIPEERRDIAYEKLMLLSKTTKYSEWLETVLWLAVEFPKLVDYLVWYCNPTPRTMIFPSWFHDANYRVHTQANTNAVEGRNSVNKEHLKNNTIDVALRYLAREIHRACKQTDYADSKQSVVRHVQC